MTDKDKNLRVLPPEQADKTASEYPLLDPASVKEMLATYQDNIGPAGLSSLDLPRIKCPTGGGLNWTLPTVDGEESLREIEGIVLAWKSGRLYWKKPFGEGGGRRPPDCVSADGFVGVGDPGGECGHCPYAQFGSASRGHGQACKQIRQILIVRPGEVVPHLLSVPPTSLRAASQYFLMLLGKQIPYWGVVTRIRLEKSTNEDGIDYARMQFTLGHRLQPEERQILQPYHQQMKDMLQPVVLDARDYTIE